MAQTTEQRATAWRSHFATQQAGDKVSPGEYVQSFSKARLQPWTLDMSFVSTLSGLPALTGFQRNSYNYMPRPRPGNCTPLCSSPLYGPANVAFRGGDLVCLAKKAGQALGCGACRSILVSSVPGKLLHRNLREALKPLLLQSQPVFQAGVAAGQGT